MSVTHAPRVTEAAARAADLQSQPAPKLPAIVQTGEARHLAARPLGYPPRIAAALMAIRQAVQPVAKDGHNKFHDYKYPRAEDVVDEVIPLLAEHGIFIAQSEVTRSLFQEEHTLAITYEYEIFNAEGDVWPTRPMRTGLAWVQDKKGTVDDKAANKCSTQSEKYFYIKFFGIRTSDAAQLDSDSGQPPEPPETGRKGTPPQPAARPAPEPPVPPVPPDSPPATPRPGAKIHAPQSDPYGAKQPPVPPEPPAPPPEPPPAARPYEGSADEYYDQLGGPLTLPPGPTPSHTQEVVDPETGEITVETRPGYQLSTGSKPSTFVSGLPAEAPKPAADPDGIPDFLKVPQKAKPEAGADKPGCHPAGFWVKRTKKTGEKVRHCSVCNSPEVLIEGPAGCASLQLDPPCDLKSPEAAPFDEKGWLRDVEGAASGCTSAVELDEVQSHVMLPVKTQVSQAAWSAARKAIAKHARRLFEEEDS